jgi:3-dehydroquinate synthase
MRKIRVKLGSRSYDIRIGAGMPMDLSRFGGKGGKVMLVSDSNVDGLYGAGCARTLKRAGATVYRAVVPAGESSKSLKRAAQLYERAAEAGLGRGDVIVALGGGMVGDLAGFVAGTYLRGVALVQVPTTLLAMVDSSVGGKTGVNLKQGKNLVGVFHQPSAVVADLTTLRSLPTREYVSGLAEVVKYGVIWDAGLFKQLEGSVGGLLDRDESLLEKIVWRCCEIKAEVVSEDEREGGLRAILNFGHTLGHAVENVAGYGTVLHGEAVAVGMVYAARLSVLVRGCPVVHAERVVDLIRNLGLPVVPPGGAEAGRWRALRGAMNADKKTHRGSLRFVLADRLGSVEIGCQVSEESLRLAFREMYETRGERRR